MFQIAWILLKEKPRIILSTGAAPGYFALVLGKRLLRTKNVWVDSIANIESLSLSGQKVGLFADLWLTQWPHLAKEKGPQYKGAVI